MVLADALLLALYYAVLAVLGVFGAQRWLMVWLHARHRADAPRPLAPLPSREEDLPRVLVQLPVYNEGAVVLRVLGAVARLDWPRGRLEVQLLDDSTDGTAAIAAAEVERLRASGLAVAHVRRRGRAGMKAGALAHGLALSDAPLVAVFDADFVPPESYLRRAVPFFADPAIGLVQARWDHANRHDSLLTELAGVGLDGHLAIEQTARNRSGRFFNFNGTAGVWRRAAIEGPGGWHADTMTEDLDLSFRAQLEGWRFVYLDDLVVASDVPSDMNALRAQQRRWARGGAQTARKLLGRVLRAPLAPHVKLEAVLQLVMGVAYPLAVLLAALMPLVLRVRLPSEAWTRALVDVPLFLAASASPFGFYVASQRALFPSRWVRRSLHAPLTVALGIGLAASNALGFLSGLAAGPSDAPGAWIPTPKRAAESERAWAPRALVRAPWAEGAFAILSAGTIALACAEGRWLALPFLSLALAGSLYAAALSLSHAAAARARMEPAWSPPTSTSGSPASAPPTAPATSASGGAGTTARGPEPTGEAIAASA